MYPLSRTRSVTVVSTGPTGLTRTYSVPDLTSYVYSRPIYKPQWTSYYSSYWGDSVYSDYYWGSAYYRSLYSYPYSSWRSYRYPYYSSYPSYYSGYYPSYYGGYYGSYYRPSYHYYNYYY